MVRKLAVGPHVTWIKRLWNPCAYVRSTI